MSFSEYPAVFGQESWLLIRGSNKMKLNASVALQPALGHALLAQRGKGSFCIVSKYPRSVLPA